MSTDPRRVAVALLASLGLSIVLAACGGDESDPVTEPELDLPGSTSTASEPTSSATTSQEPGTGVPDVRPAPEQGDPLEDRFGVWALRLPREQPEKLVAKTLVRYLEVRSEAYFEGEAPLADLARVAVGQPLTEVQGYVVDLRQDGLHTVGDFWLTLTDDSVTVRGKKATITDACAQNATANVSEQGIAQESPSDAYLTDATAVRAASDVWLISGISFEAVDSC